jgi:predicted nicotinamide N-methyase
LADDGLTFLKESLGEEISELRGVPADELPPALLDVGMQRFDVGEHEIDLLAPGDWEQLRHEEGGAGRPLPFWARPWPAGLALAEYIAQWPPPGGYRMLELGCGLALPSIVAARLGATVLATDGVADAVAYARHNFAMNDVVAEAAHVNWATGGDALLARGPFDAVLAADVLYNKDNVAAALELWPRLLGRDSHLLVVDPRRPGLRDFMLGAEGRLKVVHVEELADGISLVHFKLL